MVERNENGEIIFNNIDWNLFLGNIFSNCKNQYEVEFMRDNILIEVKNKANDRLEELNIDKMEEI